MLLTVGLLILYIDFRNGKKDVKENDKIEFDDILNHVGGWGLFQWRLLGIFIFQTFMLAYVGYSPILYTYVPDHWCHIPENMTNLFQFENETEKLDMFIPFDEMLNQRSQCQMYDSEFLLENDKNKTNVPIVKCQYGHEYNFTGYYHSVSTNVSKVKAT